MQSKSVIEKLALLSVVLLVILASLGYMYYGRWTQNVNQGAKTPPVLSSATLVLDTDAVGRQWKCSVSTTIGHHLSTLPLFSSIQADLDHLIQMGFSDKALEALPLMVSVHGMGEEEIGYVFYLDINQSPTRELLTLLDALKKDRSYEMGSKRHAGYTITTIAHGNKSHSPILYVMKHGNYMMASFSELLIEDIARGLSDKNSATFLPLKRSDFKQGGVYVNSLQWPALLRIFIKQQHVGLVQSYFRQWLPSAQLELKWSDHYLRLCGLLQDTLPAEPSSGVRSLAKGAPAPFGLSAYIPSHTAIVECHTFKDATAFVADLSEAQQALGAMDPLSLERLELLNRLLDHDIAHCRMGMEGNDQLLLIGVHTPEKVIATLEELQLLTAPLDRQVGQGQETTSYRVHTAILKHWLPVALYPQFEPTLLTLVGNCLILSNTSTALEQFKKAYRKGATWSNPQSDAYRFVASTLPCAHLNLFVNVAYAWPLIASKLKPTWKALLEKKIPSLQQTGYASLQLVNNEQRTATPSRLHVTLANMEGVQEKNQTQHIEEEAAGVKYFQADAPIITSAHFVPTHKNENLHLLLQDELYQLYFVDDQGKLIWKKRLEGPLVRNILVLDLYKNNKCQYLFATSQALHLFDYTGQEVKPYPQPLPRHGKGIRIQLVDYDKDKNYRILLADAQGNMYLKDMLYRPLPGWNPKALHAPFASTPFHIRIGKDYFFSLQANGTLYGFNRKGQHCSGFPVHIKESVASPLMVQSENQAANTQLILLTEEGKLNFYNIKGALQRSIVLEKTEDTIKFTLSSAGDKGGHYVIFRQDFDKISLWDEQGNYLFEFVYESEKPMHFQYVESGDAKFYVLTDPAKKETYIYDDQGRLLNDGIVIQNSAKEVGLIYEKAQNRLKVFTTFNKAVLKYQLAVGGNLVSQGLND